MVKKITLEYSGDDVKEGALALKAIDILLVLFELDQRMRADVKYNEGKTTTEEWRKDIAHTMEYHNVSFDEME
jgi:hypothetical protein